MPASILIFFSLFQILVVARLVVGFLVFFSPVGYMAIVFGIFSTLK